MPTPGSHSYDVRRAQLRKDLQDQGLSEKEAEDRANQMLQRDVTAPNPAAVTDRAAGPYGERTGGGDPGAVMQLRSPAFSDGALLPPRCARDGGNVSPALEWSGVPDGTAELALLCEDADAPGGTFVHWLVTGIDPGTTSIEEGREPPGSTSWPNDYGETGYGGPQPPVGDETHRYSFRLYALRRPLDLSPGAAADDVRRALDDEHLATGTLVGVFAR